jgi:hypothetical protein
MLITLTISAFLGSGALVSDAQISVAANKYCKLQGINTTGEMFDAMTPAVDSILTMPALLTDRAMDRGEINLDQWLDRRMADEIEVREMIQKQAEQRCPKKE